MEIVHYPHPALRWKSTPIREINQHLRDIVANMFRLMYQARGIGLAANQVALPYRLFIMNPTGNPKETDQEFVFLNPEITNRKGSEIAEEGCLSLPQSYGDVQRPDKISVMAYDLEGREFRMQLEELPARIVQHEGDHLDGVLFIDHVDAETTKRLQEEIDGFEATFRESQAAGTTPSDDALKDQLQAIEKDITLYQIASTAD